MSIANKYLSAGLGAKSNTVALAPSSRMGRFDRALGCPRLRDISHIGKIERTKSTANFTK
jgi:hypothetical protein